MVDNVNNNRVTGTSIAAGAGMVAGAATGALTRNYRNAGVISDIGKDTFSITPKTYDKIVEKNSSKADAKYSKKAASKILSFTENTPIEDIKTHFDKIGKKNSIKDMTDKQLRTFVQTSQENMKAKMKELTNGVFDKKGKLLKEVKDSNLAKAAKKMLSSSRIKAGVVCGVTGGAVCGAIAYMMAGNKADKIDF